MTRPSAAAVFAEPREHRRCRCGRRRRGTGPEVLLLAAVAEHPGWSQQQVADAMGVTKGNVSQLTTRPVEEGLMHRRIRGPTG